MDSKYDRVIGSMINLLKLGTILWVCKKLLLLSNTHPNSLSNYSEKMHTSICTHVHSHIDI